MTLPWNENTHLFVGTINNVQNYGGKKSWFTNIDIDIFVFIYIYIIYTYTYIRKTSNEMCQDNIQNTILR